jgi:hypothetical protein
MLSPKKWETAAALVMMTWGVRVIRERNTSLPLQDWDGSS